MKNRKPAPAPSRAHQIIALISSGTKADLFKAIELGATPTQIMIIQAASK